MSLVTITLDLLDGGLKPASDVQARDWCAQLEAGDILYFPRTPIDLPRATSISCSGSSRPIVRSTKTSPISQRSTG